DGRAREQPRDAVADRHQQVFVLGAVWLLRSLRPEREQCLGASALELNEYKQRDVCVAECLDLFAWKLATQPRATVIGDLYRFPQPPQEADDLALRDQRIEA